MDVYIRDVSAYLPNNPVPNEDIEKILGAVNRMPSRIKKLVLKGNGITTRYYAVDPTNGAPTHTNARLTAEAVRRLSPYEGFSLNDIGCLCCGTATPDQLMPGHGVMVHGELKNGPCEVMTASGICLSGMLALKYAYMSVATGLSGNAVATGSDIASAAIMAACYEGVSEQYGDSQTDLDRKALIPFDTAFLRWMLSDGAGAVFLSPNSGDGRLALKIDWIELVSYAGEMGTCMYSGARKNDDGSLTGWRHYPSMDDAVHEGAFLIKQDVKLLNGEILRMSAEKTLPGIVNKRNLSPSGIDWFLPHYSSDYFRVPFYEHLANIGFKIPFEKWFTNLSYKGNTGAASIYIILEELFHSGRLKRGDKLLCFIPESGRFSICYMLLTAV